MKYSYDTETLESEIFGDGDGMETAEPSGEETPWSEELSGPVMMAVTLEDGTEMECRVEGVFLEGQKEYIALETGQGEIQIMELGQGEDDEIQLLPVAGEEEQALVVQAFIRLFGDPQDDLTVSNGDGTDTEDEDAGETEENKKTERE